MLSVICWLCPQQHGRLHLRQRNDWFYAVLPFHFRCAGMALGVTEMLYPQSIIPGRREIQKGMNGWGSVYPRQGFLVQGDDGKAGAVMAQRAADFVVRTGQPHIYMSINTRARIQWVVATWLLRRPANRREYCNSQMAATTPFCLKSLRSLAYQRPRRARRTRWLCLRALAALSLL